MPDASRKAAFLADGLALFTSLWALWGWASWNAALRIHLGPWFWPLLLALLAFGILTTACLLGFGRETGDEPGGRLTGLFAVWIAVALIYLLAVPEYSEVMLQFSASLASAVYAALAWRRIGRTSLLPGPSVLSRAVVALGLTLLLAEVALEVCQRVWALPVLIETSPRAEERLRSQRAKAGLVHFGYPINSRGDYEKEYTRTPGQKLVVCIGDSFSLGLVPLPLHYTSVCEGELPGVEVYNMGTFGIGPPEYQLLLAREALPMKPDAIVVALFAGNDVRSEFRTRDKSTGWLRRAFDRDRLLLPRTVKGTWALVRERRSARDEGAGGGHAFGSSGDALVESLDEALRRFPWLDDPQLERATFSREGFMRKERSIAKLICDPSETFGGTLALLEEFRAEVGSIPLYLMFIPTEFQVEDGHWTTLLEELPRGLERDHPQRRLRTWCQETGIEYLDLLAAFRSVAPLDDGRRHLYHLQDSHWNRRGNERAGKELAAFLRTKLGP